MRLVVVLLVSLFVNLCNAQTYYVSPAGDDGNTGLTQADAFLTLQHAADISQAGDTINVLPGTYIGFYQSSSGTPTNPIVFLAQPNVLINEPNATTNDGINLEGANHIVIDGFNVYSVPRAGIRSVVNDGVVIRNNNCDSCGRWGILTGFSENILIENNVCSRSVIEHGIYVSNSADEPAIYNNVCWGNNANGIHMNGDAGMGGDGIISYAGVINNIIYENGIAGGSGINCDGVQNSYIANNLIYNNHASGISLYQIDGGGGSSGNRVSNNTVVQAADARWCLNINTNSTGTIVFNNIFLSEHSFRGSISIDSSSAIGLHSNHNVLVDRMSTDGGDSNMPFSQWQLELGVDSNSVLSDAGSLFVDTSVQDFHLSAGSPAIDAGIDAYFGTLPQFSDLDGNPRPQGLSMDAGVYEYQTVNALEEILAKPVDWDDVPKDAQVSIYDLSGKLLKRGSKEAVESNFSNNDLLLFTSYDRSTKSFKSGWLRVTR